MKYCLFILSTLFLCQNYTLAQNKLQRISINEGLSQSTVHAILQDEEGFMWFGTHDGLNKYNGYEFEYYKNSFTDSNSISSNKITALAEDQEGNIWIGTNRGLNKFDKKTQQFTRYSHLKNDKNTIASNIIRAIYIDSDDELWIATAKGLNKFTIATEEFQLYTTQNSDLTDNTVVCMTEDTTGNIWVGTFNGLNVLDKTTGAIKQYFKGSVALKSNKITSLYLDSNSDVWIASYNGGISKYLYSTNEFIQYDTSVLGKEVSSDHVGIMTEGEEGGIWMGTWGNGVIKIDKNMDRVIHYVNSSNEVNSLSYNTVYSVYSGTNNLLWIGTFGGGVNKLNLNKQKFKTIKNNPNNSNSINHNSIREIYKDQDNILWIGTYGGLNKYDLAKNNFTHYSDNNGLGNVYAITQDMSDENILWIGNEGVGLYEFKKDTEEFIKITLPINEVFSILDNEDGYLYLGTRVGIIQYHKKTEKIIVFKSNDEYNALESVNEIYNYLYKDNSGTLWIASNLALYQFNIQTKQFKKYQHDPLNKKSISHSSIRSIYEDSKNRLWVATNGRGLNLMDRKTETFTSYTVADGLPNNVVYGILEDKNENLWLSTNKGLSMFNVSLKTFKNYTVDHGLQSNEFNTNSFYKSTDGELFFGGIDGLNSFYPESIMDESFMPPIVLTSFKIFDKAQQITIDKIVLNHSDDFISFEFAALDFSVPERNQYAYKLEGFNNKWIYAGNRRYVSYTNLKPGNYVFRVKGTNGDGVWSDKQLAIPIIVSPPFWGTWWFYVVSFLMLVLVVFLFIKVRINQIQLKSKEQFFRKQNEEKILMMQEIHHRVKNNLQVVNSLLSLQASKIDDDQVVSLFKETQKRIHSMALLHEKLYNAKDLSYVNIKEHFSLLIEGLVKSYSVNKKISLTIDIEEFNLGMKTLVPLGLIINEIITNSLKYAFHDRDEGEIKVRLLNLNSDEYQLIIEDNGVGFKENPNSKGLGAKLIPLLVKQLDGKIIKKVEDGTVYEILFHEIG